jgi:P-type conjugative transfer protein TrbJ
MRSMRRKRLAVSVLCALVVWMSPANAQWVVTDPTLTMKSVMAEAARLGQTATMIQNQINQYTNMVQNTLRLGDPVFAPLGNAMRSLYSVYTQGQSLMWRAQNIDQQFAMANPSYMSYLYSMGQGGSNSISAKYQQWSDNGSQNIRQALLASGAPIDSMASDDDLLKQLVARSATSQGQMSALQAGNEIGVFTARQLQQLQTMVYAQTKLQADYMAIQNQRQSVNDAWLQNYLKVPTTNSPAKTYILP